MSIMIVQLFWLRTVFPTFDTMTDDKPSQALNLVN